MIKAGVNITGIRPEILLAIIIARPIFEEYGVPFVITSALEGRHSRTSLHYAGQAVDFRISDLLPEARKEVTERIAVALGVQFDVVLEKTHIHVEFQPKITIT